MSIGKEDDIVDIPQLMGPGRRGEWVETSWLFRPWCSTYLCLMTALSKFSEAPLRGRQRCARPQ